MRHPALALDAELQRASSTSPTHRTRKTRNDNDNTKSSPVSVLTDASSASSGSPLTSGWLTPNHHQSTFTATVTTTVTKRVRFGGVHERVITQKPPSKSERKNLWYTAKEIRTIRTEICALNMSCGGSAAAAGRAPPAHLSEAAFDEIGNTWRGLEHVRQGALMLKLEHRRNFVQAFLYFSHELGVRDPGALSVFSSTNSKVDRQRAVQLATQDAMEACKIYYAFLKSEKLLQQERARAKAIAAAEQETRSAESGGGGSSKLWRRERRPGKSTPRHSDKRPFKTHVRNLTSLSL